MDDQTKQLIKIGMSIKQTLDLLKDADKSEHMKVLIKDEIRFYNYIEMELAMNHRINLTEELTKVMEEYKKQDKKAYIKEAVDEFMRRQDDCDDCDDCDGCDGSDADKDHKKIDLGSEAHVIHIDSKEKYMKLEMVRMLLKDIKEKKPN